MVDAAAGGERFSVAIDARALQEHVDALGAIGRHPAGGLYRTLYTSAWQEAIALVRRWLEEAGLETRTDAVGNLFGRLPGRESARAVLRQACVRVEEQPVGPTGPDAVQRDAKAREQVFALKSGE